MEKRTAADFLEEVAGIYRDRKSLYGYNYRHVGRAFDALFPDGLHIAPGDQETWNRLHFVFHMYSKLCRYAMNLQRGGHQDSLDDLAVYAMIARECDAEAARGSDVEDALAGRKGRHDDPLVYYPSGEMIHWRSPDDVPVGREMLFRWSDSKRPVVGYRGIDGRWMAKSDSGIFVAHPGAVPPLYVAEHLS